MSAVQVGQLWASVDKRDVRRGSRQRVLVVETDETHAVLEDLATERRTRVLLRRMRPSRNGYRLIQEAR